MSEKSCARDAQKWKQKYHDNLDLLDQKQSDWQSLESILKKAVLRLSITAEGQNKSIDRHLHEIRGIVKKQIDILRLDNKLDDISDLLIKLDAQKATADIKVVTALTQLLQNTHFPATADKQKNKLIKKLAKSSDEFSDSLTKEVQAFFDKFSFDKSTVPQTDGEVKKSTTGFLARFFSTGDDCDEENKKTNTSGNVANNSIVSSVSIIAKALPWPKELKKESKEILEKLSKANNHDAEDYLKSLIKLISKWQKIDRNAKASDVISIDFDDEESSTSLVQEKYQSVASYQDFSHDELAGDSNSQQPSSQEVLIRLLEQLTIPPGLHEEVVSIKQRLGEEYATTNWKQLLKDVAQLINTLRNQMQEEKQEFEIFLQQITGRLQEMESFLSVETDSLNDAELASDTFDVVVSAQVKDIHDDMSSANDLNDLKNKVEKRLNVVADHIKEYRTIEQTRYVNAQQNVKNMQSRLADLEQESVNLKKQMIEKSKEAMFDALTKIPNRLAYEKKAIEEISRCNDSGAPLSMAVWDIDLFKQVNDTYGHKVGDKVLKAIAQILEERMRETDFIARYGGEEFVMFLPGVNEDEAIDLTEAIRQKISACQFNHQGKVIRVTVSCGISHFIKNDNQETMFDRADKALYVAKEKGRNQCITAASLAE